MIRQIAFSCLLLPIFLLCGCNGTDRLEDELEDALNLLDEEIMRFPQTMKVHYDKVNALTDSLENTSDVNLKFKLYTSLIDNYSQLSEDTMAVYSEQMLALARQCKDRDAEVYATMALCAVAQMKEDFSGALNRFESMDPSGASDELVYDYYLRGESVYYSLFIRAFNAPEDVYLNHHATYYRDKLAQLRSMCLQMDSTSFRAHQIRISELRDSERYDESLCLLKSIRNLADNPTRIASWHRYNAVLYDFLGDQDNRLVHLAMSSVYNLRCPTRDNLSLISLARALRKRGDLERASRYISVATTNSFQYKQVARMSYAESASNKIMALLAKKEKSSRQYLYASIVVLCILLIVVTYAFYYNLKLRRKLETSYRQLREANLLKNNYLFEYMVRSASYIDSADSYHKELRKMAKKDGIEKVYDVLKLPSRFEDDKKRFYAMFDENFLSMFPNFIARVNEMMRPDMQYRLVRDGQLPVELRVLAVMRMGMTDSAQIASFMSYSISTVYTYRCRAAEKSCYKREEFERRLSKISLE
jgi:hypothetical protein